MLDLPENVEVKNHGKVHDVAEFLEDFFPRDMPAVMQNDIAQHQEIGFPLTGYHFVLEEAPYTHHIVVRDDPVRNLSIAAQARYETSVFLDLVGASGLLRLVTELDMDMTSDEARNELYALPPMAHKEIGVVVGLNRAGISVDQVRDHYNARLKELGYEPKTALDIALPFIDKYRAKLLETIASSRLN